MVNFIFGLLLAFGAITVWVMQRTYQSVPAHELKRLARHGDDVAQLLYKAVAYGASLRVLLGGSVVLFGVLSLVCLSNAIGVWLASLTLLIFAGLASVTFASDPGARASNLWLARQAAPTIGWVLERLQPVLNWFVRLFRKYHHVTVHTGLYEKTDLVELLERQKGQVDSRISAGEIMLLQHALTFGEKQVSDAMVPKRVVTMVATTDVLGPVLMDELARSGHSRFPVYEGKKDNIVGILYLHDLIGTKKTGAVDSLMSTKLTYVHEDFSLYEVLQAFLKTKRHLFLVVNSFEELVGIITIEDVLEQVIGVSIVDEFDRYDDLRAVAAKAAHKDHQVHHEPKPEAQTTPEAKEVVK